jgi:hypothetical protein
MLAKCPTSAPGMRSTLVFSNEDWELPNPSKSGFLLIGLSPSTLTAKRGLSSPFNSGDALEEAALCRLWRQLLPKKLPTNE